MTPQVDPTEMVSSGWRWGMRVQWQVMGQQLWPLHSLPCLVVVDPNGPCLVVAPPHLVARCHHHHRNRRRRRHHQPCLVASPLDLVAAGEQSLGEGRCCCCRHCCCCYRVR